MSITKLRAGTFQESNLLISELDPTWSLLPLGRSLNIQAGAVLTTATSMDYCQVNTITKQLGSPFSFSTPIKGSSSWVICAMLLIFYNRFSACFQGTVNILPSRNKR